MTKSKVHCVVGGQFGSEAKGAVAAFLSTQIKGPVVGVRVGGPNAGHTVYGNCPPACTQHLQSNGLHPWRLRQVPVLAVSRPDADLIIAQGSEVDVEVLLDEVAELDGAGYNVSGRLTVDGTATVILPDHKFREEQGKLNDRIGSTAKGIGAARADRIMRNAPIVSHWGYSGTEDDDLSLTHIPRRWIADTTSAIRYVHMAYGRQIIIEGTQGYGLGLHTQYYPFTTSGDCRAIDLLAQCGISPWGTHPAEVHVWLVVRPNPIRVAGNSGPLLGETTWEELGLPSEQTTVTKKTRRVGAWDPDAVNEAIHANGGPSSSLHVVLSMLDHLVPELRGIGDRRHISDELVAKAQTEVDRLNNDLDAKIELVGTGPATMIWYSNAGHQAVAPDTFGELRSLTQHLIQTMGVAAGSVAHTIPDRIAEVGDYLPFMSGDELTDWWLDIARAEVEPMVQKALEYGGKGAAIDLIEIGRDLGRLAGKKDIDDAEATELGIYFYLRGKFGRWQAAVLEGRQVSDDTLHDIGVYIRMAQRTRAVGGWPYAPEGGE